MSQFIINIDGTIEQDKVFLSNRLLHRKGELYPVENLRTKMNLDSNDEVSFTIYKYCNGILNPFWNMIDDLAIVLVEGKGYFELSVPKTTEDCNFKEISGISLCEAETSQTNITIEINTEDDIARSDYIPTILYNPDNTEGSLLHRVFKEMPHYKIGHVDEAIAGLQRTFSCDNQSVYNFLQTVAEELECIFIFDNFSRTVNCYKLEDYGKDSGVFIDGTENLAESITITGNKDSVKNCFKIEGGDDTITNRIGNRLIGGNHIWKFSTYQLKQMSETLQNALADREKLVDSYQDEYNGLWDDYNQKLEDIIYYQSGMMPSEKNDETTAESVFEEIFGTNGKITYACSATKYQGASTIASSITNFAKVIAPSSYTVELTNVSSTTIKDGVLDVINTITFNVHVYLTDQYEKNADGIEVLMDEYTSDSITLPVKKGYNLYATDGNESMFTTDYYLYLKQQMEIAEEKSEITDEVITFNPPLDDTATYNSDTTPLKYAEYDNEENPENFSSIHYTMYCINRLQSFYDAYESCSQVLAKLNSDIASNDASEANAIILGYTREDGSKGYIYDDLLGKYGRYMECISARITYLQTKVDFLTKEANDLMTRINEIKEVCNMQNFLENYLDGTHGIDLWVELCSFRREDTYTNDNYIGEDMDETTLMENVEGLIERAKEEISKACEINYSITTTLGNLLVMKEFESFWDNFNLGNYIRIRIDEEIYKLRLISIIYNYDDLSHIEVEFSDTTKNNSVVNDVKNILQQASDMAGSFNFVARQAEKGSTASDEMNDIQRNGLDIANTMITDANHQEFVINEYGITGRKWDEISESYEGEQIRIINNLLCFTDDNWKHTKTAIGKIFYYDAEKGEYVYDYGIHAPVLVGNLILSEKMRIVNQSGTYTIDDNGFRMENNNKYIMLDPSIPSIVANDGVQNVLDFNSNGDGTFKIFGDIVGGKITIGNNFTVDEYGMMSCTDGIFNGTVNAIKGNIGGWKLDAYGMCSNGAYYFTTIGNEEIYRVDGIYYQTTIRDGKIICGVDGNVKNFPDTNHGYTDMSPAGVFVRHKDMCNEDDKDKYHFLFAADNVNKYVFMDNNIYLKTYSSSGSIVPLLGWSIGNNIHIGDYDNISIADNCYIHATNIYKSTSGGNSSLSDSRFKKDVQGIDNAIDFITSLKPVKYKYTDGTSDRFHFGFLAQDIEKSLEKTTGDAGVLVKYTLNDDGILDLNDESTYICGLRYEELIAPLVSCIQDLYEEIRILKEK